MRSGAPEEIRTSGPLLRRCAVQNSKPEFRNGIALFCPNSVKFQLEERNFEEDKTAHWKITCLGGGDESGITRDRARSHRSARRWCFLNSAAARVLRGGEATSAVSSHFPQRDRSRGELHGIFAFGGVRGATLCPHEFPVCQCSPGYRLRSKQIVALDLQTNAPKQLQRRHPRREPGKPLRLFGPTLSTQR